MEPLVVAAALAGGTGLAALAVVAAWRYARPPRARESTVQMEIVIEDDAPIRFVPPAAKRGADAAGAVSSAVHAPAARLAPAAPARAASPPPPTPRAHASRAPAMLLTQGVAMQDESFSRHAPSPRAPAPPAERAPMRMPPPAQSWAQQAMAAAGPEVQTEWARRQVGPVGPGRVAGACGGCGARLSITTQRPLRIACPVCGRTKLLA